MIDRRNFLGSAALFAAVPGMASAHAAVPKGPARLKLGLLSDIHITDRASCSDFEKALRTFDKWGADGVLCSGDIADWGVAPQIDFAAETWFKVFPGGRRSDGAPMANLLHYGDHDCCGYFYRGHPGCVKTYPDVEEMKKVSIRWTDRKAIWEKAFKEEWAPLVHKRVKGYDFVLSHFTCGEKNNEWGNFVPGLEEFFAKLAPKLEKGKPFFYSQHRIPRGTVGGQHIYGQDDGKTTKLFSKFPDLCAFCGHKHLTCTDEMAVWQGAFTCVAVPSLSYCGTQPGRDNGIDDFDKWKEPDWQMPLFSLGHTKQGLFLEIYDNAMVISRHDYRFGWRLGPDWVVPLPLSGDNHPFDYACRKAAEKAPVFADGAKLAVKRLNKKERDGKEHDVYEVTFPPAHAKGDSLRANDYEVQASTVRCGVERAFATKRVYSRYYMFPEDKDKDPVVCDIDAALVDSLARQPVRFTARPVGAFGANGAPISRDFSVAELARLAARSSPPA